MQGMDAVLKAIEHSGLILEAADLSDEDKVHCFLLWNSVRKSIVMDNKNYKTKNQLDANINATIIDFRVELYAFLKKHYSELEVISGVTLTQAMDEILAMPCNNLRSDVEVLSMIASIMYVAISHTESSTNKTAKTLQCIMYTCIIAINQICVVEGEPPLLEGVNLIFYERKTKIH